MSEKENNEDREKKNGEKQAELSEINERTIHRLLVAMREDLFGEDDELCLNSIS